MSKNIFNSIEDLEGLEVIQFDEKTWYVVDSQQPIQPGDTYLAERNTGMKLLVCDKVKNGGIFPKPGGETMYPYDDHECVKVIRML